MAGVKRENCYSVRSSILGNGELSNFWASPKARLRTLVLKEPKKIPLSFHRVGDYPPIYSLFLLQIYIFAFTKS